MRFNRLGVLALGLVLAGCVANAPAVTRNAPPSVALLGDIAVAGPKGYCAEPSGGASGEDGGEDGGEATLRGDKPDQQPISETLLMARCADVTAVPPAIIAVTVGQKGSAGVMAVGGQKLASFFSSDDGRATLSRRGQATDVQLLEALSQRVEKTEAFLMRLDEPSMGQHWRAIVGMRGRLVTVSVVGPTDSPLDPAQGRSLLEQMLSALHHANKA
jgi:hypothetical protein